MNLVVWSANIDPKAVSLEFLQSICFFVKKINFELIIQKTYHYTG